MNTRTYFYKVIPIRLDEEMREKMKTFRIKTNTNYSQQVRFALRSFFARPENLEQLEIKLDKKDGDK